ncbi:hypothetical protein [Chamaesiphon sp. OTE_75_metabat_556]|jgi:hypothetical protein|uniref:hypothetical protein n=1 Tax=Chamaesiphon sp. OTE_75_metabat_556 TaxID=2964692 RepID=UPI00286D09F1|nr:hypothetical protein [Chamaesiphon sp. OTE_75_metabat_556]
MISRQAVLEYLHKHPNHSTWQMRLHFLQASRQPNNESQISIGSIANQLNYILRDLEAIGTISPRPESASVLTPDPDRSNRNHSHNLAISDREHNR